MSDLVLRVYAAVVCRLGDARRGATAVEYGLLVALVLGVCMTVLTAFSGGNAGLYATFTSIAEAIR